jgi:putative transposase
MATGPNQVWSWDITKLRGPTKGLWFFLYVIMDIFSRYVVGWLVAERESEALARELIDAACAKQGVGRGQLVLHADRGSPMVAGSVASLLDKLGVVKSHSRPHVSNDNPFSEAGFKTMKYHPTFPDHFDGIHHSRTFCGSYFLWYNEEHYHTGIALLTPATVHYGRTAIVLAERQTIMDAAYVAHPDRFVQGPPKAAAPPGTVWINAPAAADEPIGSVAGCLDPTPAPAVDQPGAEPESRAGTPPFACPAERTLDSGEHRAIIVPGQAVAKVDMTVLQ